MTNCIRSVGNAARGSLLTAVMFFSTLVAPDAQAAQSARGASRIATETTGQRWPRDFERVANRMPSRPRRVLPSYRDVAEDFKQLQLKNYSLSQEAGRGAALDYVRIRKDAAEVKKRASRLRTNLFLPEPNKELKAGGGEEVAPTETLTAAATSLNALVKSFVRNPMFQQPGVIDLELSSKASRDLESIIRLSEQIRRRAEGLGKGSGKP